MSTAPATASSASSAAALPEIRVYNTLSKSKEPFAPLRPPHVGMYLCGPTVYKESHIGHMVGPVIFDTIKRYLSYCGYQVTWVVNITDVDDKLIAQSRERGIPMSQIAVEMTADYLANLRELGVNQIDQLPRATDHIEGIVHFIETLVEKGYAYASSGDVFFDVARDPNYGQLSNRLTDQMLGDGGGAAAKKRSPGDFALWKSAKPDEPSWPSPWGNGRPGWHIECSAMSHAYLGETFDIHGGGLDLVFPHHENERAQSSCCHGAPMAKYWMHNGLMRAGAAGKVGGRSDRAAESGAAESGAAEGGATTEGLDAVAIEEQSAGKISRSKGAGGLSELIQRHTGERLRFFLLRTHYRSTIVFNDEGLEEAATALDAFYRFFDRFEQITARSFYSLPAARWRRASALAEGEGADADATLAALAAQRAKYLDAMDDDFNTGAAISVLFDMLRTLNRHIDQQQLAAGAQSSDAGFETLLTGAEVLRELTAVLGLFAKPQAAAGGGGQDGAEFAAQLMEILIELRKQARTSKNFAMADAIRDSLTACGVSLLDSKDGTSWERQRS
ncbi:cysteine--tRNA ligase [Candidatus Laterigemmans baculatus]|uniref:cysteine--tRNA ligase n=1 Tax=Candidatus Laterigemmans baculatus TaxID=2770505 RepID=UPI0013DC05C3|nr:cysteine--tRNA ligase [Candidatus Laterigemmans baculatus]